MLKSYKKYLFNQTKEFDEIRSTHMISDKTSLLMPWLLYQYQTIYTTLEIPQKAYDTNKKTL